MNGDYDSADGEGFWCVLEVGESFGLGIGGVWGGGRREEGRVGCCGGC